MTICYRHHPFYNCSGRIVRRFRCRGGEQFIVQLEDGTSLAVPAWMLDLVSCARLVLEPRPRLALESLREVRRLIELHTVSRAAGVVSIDVSSSPSGERHEETPSHDEAPAPTAAAVPGYEQSS